MLTIARLAAEQKELRIVYDQIGAPTSARAIANAVTKMVEAGLPSLRNRIGKCDTVNITCSGETSWFGFAEAILDGLRKRNLGRGRSALYRLRVRTILHGPCVHAILVSIQPGRARCFPSECRPGERHSMPNSRPWPNSAAYRLRHLCRPLWTRWNAPIIRLKLGRSVARLVGHLKRPWGAPMKFDRAGRHDCARSYRSRIVWRAAARMSEKRSR